MSHSLFIINADGQGLMTFDENLATEFANNNDRGILRLTSWDDMKFHIGNRLTDGQVETLYNERSVYFTQGVM